MKVLAIIQARMGSTRLPGKVLMPLCGESVLTHVIKRVGRCRLIDGIIVATTDKIEDDIIEKHVRGLNVNLYRGSEKNVLDRYYNAAKKFKADIIVRITSDDPLIDYEIIDKIIENIINEKTDYSCNNIPKTYPLGLDCECFRFEALEYAWKNAREPEELEHVTPYIRKHDELFKKSTLVYKKDLSKLRWTLDTIEDYKYISNIYENLYEENNFFLMDDILNFINIE